MLSQNEVLVIALWLLLSWCWWWKQEHAAWAASIIVCRK